MKKILLFIDNLGSGGAQRRLVNISILLKNEGYDITILKYSTEMFYTEQLEKNNIKIETIISNSYINRIIDIRNYLKRKDIDILISFLEVPNFIASIAKATGAHWKLITTESSAKDSTFCSFRNRIFNLLEGVSDAKVCNSYNSLKLWEAHYPQYRKKYNVIYNPVIIPEKYFELKKIYNRKKKMVVAASYQENKNPINLIKAVNLLDEDEKNKIEVDWYGRAEATNGNFTIYKQAVKMVDDLNLKNVVHLHQVSKRIFEAIAEADIIGLFSFVEGMPNAIAEGMTLGKVVIMTKVSDYELLTDGNGVVCDAASPQSIRDAICYILKIDNNTFQNMSEKSLEKGKNLFSPEVIISKWIELIERVS